MLYLYRKDILLNMDGKVAMYNKIYSYIDDDASKQYKGLGLHLKDNFSFVKRTMKSKHANVKSGKFSLSVYIDTDISEEDFNNVVDKTLAFLRIPENKQQFFYYTNGREQGDKKYTYTNFKPLSGNGKEKLNFIEDSENE